MSDTSVELRAKVDNLLGEGTLWHPPTRSLFWFDILRHEIFRLSEDGVVERRALGRQASAAAWMDTQRLIVATDDGLYEYAISSGETTRRHDLEADRPQNRSNDGRCDPWGRMWVGTMDRDGKGRSGAIYVYDGRSPPTLVRDRLGIPNSIAFSPDRRRAYFADSTDQTIFCLDLDPASGAIKAQSTFATTAGSDAVPDGSVVDAEGDLWNAQWDGWRVVRYRPDGKIRQIIELPVQRPTCPAFGGSDMRTIFVASARVGLDDAALDTQPMAGSVVSFRTDTPGLPEYRFSCRSVDDRHTPDP